jgi:hypothetical protein
LVLTAFLSGCLPFPHRVTATPAIAGKVHRNERPVENAAVYIENGAGQCSFRGNVLAHTNGKGEFCFQPTKEWRFFLVMDPAHSLRVCIAEGDKRYEGWAESGIGYAADMTLDCDLENDGGRGTCNANLQDKKKRN